MKNDGFFANRRVIFVLSLLLAFISWIVIAGFINPGSETPMVGILIDYERYAQQYIDKNLQIVGVATPLADVLLEGDGAVLGGLDEEAVAVNAYYGGVTGPGTFEVPLRVEKVASGTYSITDVSINDGTHAIKQNPKNTVTLTFEEISEKSFDVTVRADEVTAAAGFFRDPPFADPLTVRVSGPKSKVDLVARVVAEVTVQEELDATKAYTAGNVLLLDKSGAVLDAKALDLALDVAEIRVTVPILESITIELAANFIGQPRGFDMEWFKTLVRLSESSMQVMGPAEELDHVDNPYLVADFDLRGIDIGWESDPVTIQLPDGLRSGEQLRQITVGVDTAGFVEKSFEVPEGNFRVTGALQNAVVTPVGNSVSVRLIGPAEQMDALLPENISVQLDASRLAANTGGQHAIPARVSVPSAGRLIPVGEYSVVCDVSFE